MIQDEATMVIESCTQSLSLSILRNGWEETFGSLSPWVQVPAPLPLSAVLPWAHVAKKTSQALGVIIGTDFVTREK